MTEEEELDASRAAQVESERKELGRARMYAEVKEMHHHTFAQRAVEVLLCEPPLAAKDLTFAETGIDPHRQKVRVYSRPWPRDDDVNTVGFGQRVWNHASCAWVARSDRQHISWPDAALRERPMTPL